MGCLYGYQNQNPPLKVLTLCDSTGHFTESRAPTPPQQEANVLGVGWFQKGNLTRPHHSSWRGQAKPSKDMFEAPSPGDNQENRFLELWIQN